MLTNRITFYLGTEGLPSWLIKAIHSQQQNFDGDIKLLKVKTMQQVNAQDHLSAMTLAFHPFDLCQIILTTNSNNANEVTPSSPPHQQPLTVLEAEIKQVLPKDCFIIQKESTASSNQLGYRNFHFQFFHIEKELTLFKRFFKHAQQSSESLPLEKSFVLQFIAKHANFNHQTQIEQQLKQREAISSTGMKDGIAFPHLISDGVIEPKLICITTGSAIDWGSNLGQVTHILALILPKPFEKEAMMGVSRLATKLVDEQYRQLITNHHSSIELQVILNCLMEP